jgi:predicted metal-dependent phosphoesterase TrpH
MPAREPFTSLCRLLARPPAARADLHLHTTHSDGLYSPAEVVDLARRAGLAAIAVTDHDTLAGVAAARAAAGAALEVVPGVEITAEFRGRELHLLGYFVAAEGPLNAALERLRRARVTRFCEMIDRLRGQGVPLDGDVLAEVGPAPVLGRRHLAEVLVRRRQVGTVREAFRRYLGDGGRADVPKVRLPVAEAIARVRAAGGVSAWAHPPQGVGADELRELAGLGLGALEVEYPSFRGSRVSELRDWAKRFGLAVSGGSDCHGPEPAGRTVGARTISDAELEDLRRRAR